MAHGVGQHHEDIRFAGSAHLHALPLDGSWPLSMFNARIKRVRPPMGVTSPNPKTGSACPNAVFGPPVTGARLAALMPTSTPDTGGFDDFNCLPFDPARGTGCSHACCDFI